MFNVGDKVLIYHDHHDKSPRQSTVAKTMSTYVLLANGEKFTPSGKKWGSGNSWFYSYIKVLDAELLASMEDYRAEQRRAAHKRAVIKAIVNFVSYDMATPELDRLAAQLQNMGMPVIVE